MHLCLQGKPSCAHTLHKMQSWLPALVWDTYADWVTQCLWRWRTGFTAVGRARNNTYSTWIPKAEYVDEHMLWYNFMEFVIAHWNHNETNDWKPVKFEDSHITICNALEGKWDHLILYCTCEIIVQCNCMRVVSGYYETPEHIRANNCTD